MCITNLFDWFNNKILIHMGKEEKKDKKINPIILNEVIVEQPKSNQKKIPNKKESKKSINEWELL